MCMSTPKVKPVASAPSVSPESIDEAALAERDRELRRNRNRGGRASTIIAGNTGVAPTAPVKTALGT